MNKKTKSLSLHLQKWPEYDESLLVKDEVTMVVQVNGRLRATIATDKQQSTNQKFAIEMAKENESVKKHLAGKTVKKEIFIPGKLVNFVI